MKRQCAICENEFEEHEMMQISPSPAHPKWLCWECHKKGHGEVTGFETQSKRKKMKEANRK